MENNELIKEFIRKELQNKTSDEKEKEFQEFKEPLLNVNLNNLTTTKTLKVDRINSLDDVKRLLKFLNITVEADGYIEPNGYDEVRDLFDY